MAPQSFIQANALHLPIADRTVQCVVTSPPYWGLRDYGTARWEGGDPNCQHQFKREDNRLMYGSDGTLGKNCTSWTHRDATPPRLCSCGARRIDSQLGLERTPEEYVANMVAVFREVKRVLRDDGTLWCNLGDAYAHGKPGGGSVFDNGRTDGRVSYEGDKARGREKLATLAPGLKPKDLVGIPWRVAFALQADGWYLRSDIIWAKPNPMPESVTDRPTKSHEYLFLLAKSERYYYDAEAIKEPAIEGTDLGLLRGRNAGGPGADKIAWHAQSILDRQQAGIDSRTANPEGTRNKRSVWTIATQPYSGAHFATFPEALVEPCILAGSAPGDLVLDPFAGSGTVNRVATRLQRRAVGCDISRTYLVDQAKRRNSNVQVRLFV